jgi:hypothetical protein
MECGQKKKKRRRRSLGSSVGIATGYGLDGRGYIPCGDKDFFSLLHSLLYNGFKKK